MNMIFKRLLGFLLIAVGFASAVTVPFPSARAAETVATDIRVGVHESYTRFVLDLTRAVDVDMFVLADPYRVVLDLPETGWQLPAKPLPTATGIYKTLRYSLYKPGQSRMVIETLVPFEVRQAVYLKPTAGGTNRLVLDLAPIERTAFLSRVKDRYAIEAREQSATTVAAVPAQQTAIEILPTGGQENALPAGPRKPSVIPTPPRKRVIAIDAGHGGRDPGAISRSGAYEKHITLAFAREMKAVLEATGRYTVHLVRDRDVFIPLRDRVARARKVNPDLFMSLHADTVENRRIQGLSVYTLSETASDKEAARLAERENKADIVAGMDFNNEPPEVANILIDLAQRESMNESARYANTLINKARPVTNVLKRTHRFAGFAVLKAPDVPSVLVELGFLSNPEDERKLLSRDYRRNFAAASLKSLDDYFATVQQAHTY